MNKKVVKIAIIVAWCLLGACVLFKLFGSEVFAVAVESTRFIEICNWLDTDGIWLRYILMFILGVSSSTFIILSSALKPNPSWKWVLIVVLVGAGVWGLKFLHPYVAFGVECIELIVMPALISKKWYYGFIGLGLNFAFQALSLFVRGERLEIFESNTILSLVLMIDYYIMIALYYMYAILINKNKEGATNG